MFDVVFVTPWYGVFAGGMEVEIRTYAEYLAKLNFKVCVFTTCCGSPYKSWVEDHLPAGKSFVNGIEVHRFPVNKELKNHDLYHEAVSISQKEMVPEKKYQYNFFRYGISSDELIKAVGGLDKETRVVCGSYFQSLIFCLLEAHPNRVYLRAAFHDEPQIQWSSIADMIKNAKGILFGTTEEKRLAIRHHGSVAGRRLVETPVTGVPIGMTSVTLESEGKSPFNYPYFVYVGRKECGKNFHLVVKWFEAFVTAGNQDFRLVMLGGGDNGLVPDSPAFEDMGYVDDRMKRHVLQYAQGLINLSCFESFSLVAMEAWLCKIPVVVHQDCEVLNGHCTLSQGGIAVADESSYVAALSRLSDKATRNQLGAKGFDYVIQNYAPSKVVNNFIRMLSHEENFD